MVQGRIYTFKWLRALDRSLKNGRTRPYWNIKFWINVKWIWVCVNVCMKTTLHLQVTNVKTHTTMRVYTLTLYLWYCLCKYMCVWQSVVTGTVAVFVFRLPVFIMTYKAWLSLLFSERKWERQRERAWERGSCLLYIKHMKYKWTV